MKRVSASFATLLVVALAIAGCGMMPGSESGWITLVDGTTKSLENWNRIGDANWRIEDGALVADKGEGGYLVSKNSYKDFEIRAEFWADHNTNSGIFLRAADPKKIGAVSSYEVNIYDQRPEPKYGTGAIVDVAAVPVPITNKAGGHWNTYEITAKGSQFTVRLNGLPTVTGQDAKLSEGPVGLQYALGGANGAQGGPIKWRKVQVRAL
jgi:hypothetical protein